MSHLSLLEANFERDEKEIPLRRAEISIGRDPDRDIVLPDKSVSRRHAFLKPAEKGFRIVDNNSSNGVAGSSDAGRWSSPVHTSWC